MDRWIEKRKGEKKEGRRKEGQQIGKTITG